MKTRIARTRTWRAKTLFAVLAASSALHQGAANAQLPQYCVTGPDPDPAVFGQWQGPYDLQEITDFGWIVEIVHSVVLPSEAGAVLFWCRPNETMVAGPNPTVSDARTRTFLWKPRVPQGVSKTIVVPNPTDASQDLFCGGHQWLDDGTLLAFGGTDFPATFTPTVQYDFVGHRGIYRFDPVTETWSADPNLLADPRWYPYGFLLPTNELFVIGHTSCPDANGIFNCPGTPPTVPIQEFHERWSPTGISQVENRLFSTGTLCATGANKPVGGYPRMHLLSSGHLLYFNGGLLDPSRTLVYRFDACLQQPPVDRFDDSKTFTGATQHGEGNSVHFVWYDSSLTRHDTVYQMAGVVRATPNPDFTSAAVEKITDPYDVNMAWQAVAPLPMARTDSNAVILPTGEILVLGGDADTLPNFLDPPDPVFCTALYEPPEIIPSSAQQWILCANHQRPRTYHSTAGLLPDGRVYIAGGDANSLTYHSVEIYSPRYLFRSRPPEVSNLSATTWTVGSVQPPTFDVTTAGPNVTVDRVCLIRLGSTTHGFDDSQRYVQLRLVQMTGTAPNLTVQVSPPDSANEAPRGDYFLFVVDSNGVPSHAKIIRIN